MLLNAHCFFMSLPNDCGLAIIIIVALQICEGGNQEWVEDSQIKIHHLPVTGFDCH